MKRISIVGLCLVAAFALSAMVASSASAGTYYWCKAMKKGEYTTGQCTTKSSKPHKGKYEKKPVATCEAQKKGEYTTAACTTKSSKPKKGKYEKTKGRKYTSTGGHAALSTPDFGEGKVECESNTDSGELTGPKTDLDRVTFRGCSFEGLKCESIGENSTPSGEAGVIVTNELESRLVDNPETITFYSAETNKYETKGPAVGEVWEELANNNQLHHPYSSEFDCGGVVALRTVGQDTGQFVVATLNKLATGSEVEFKAGEGADGLLTEVNIAGGGWEGPAPSIEEAGTAKVTNEGGTERIEIRS